MFGLRQKLSLGFGGLLLIILIIGVRSIFQFQELGQSIDVILRENYRSVVACQEMKEALERMDSGMYMALLRYDQEGRNLILANEERFGKALEIELGNITLPGEGEKAAALKEIFGRYREALHGMLGQDPSKESRSADSLKEIQPLFQKAKETADDILRMNQDNMNDANERARKQAASARQRMYVFLAFGLLIAAAFIFFTGRWILRPINRLIRSSEEIQRGNLDLVVPADSSDEIGRLAAAFNEMAASLREFRRSEQAKLIRTQKAVQEAFENLPDAVAIADLDGQVEIATASAGALFGLKPGVRLLDSPAEPVHDLFRCIVDGACLRYKTEQHVFQFFVQGEERVFQASIAPITDQEKHMAGVILIARDITEQRRLEEMKSGLISTVSHQLKTPLTSIRMALHLLLEEKVGPLTEKQAELLVAAREESDLLHGILSNLLDISRLEAGGLQMACQEVPARALALEAVESFRRAAQDGGLELETDLPGDLPPVCADPDRIRNVFANLLSNALNHTPPGGRITISASEEEGMVRFTVTDTGSGIPEEYLPRIFERFFRVPDQQEAGAGLGLSIAKEIVEAHGGTIRAESRMGLGAAFSFTLKRADPASRQM